MPQAKRKSLTRLDRLKKAQSKWFCPDRKKLIEKLENESKEKLSSNVEPEPAH